MSRKCSCLVIGVPQIFLKSSIVCRDIKKVGNHWPRLSKHMKISVLVSFLQHTCLIFANQISPNKKWRTEVCLNIT